MFKVVVLIKRRSGMSMEDFMEYYETQHAPLAVSRVPNFKRYVRHYIRPYGEDIYSGNPEAPYDVLTEIWFDDATDFARGMAYLEDPETAAIIGADEEMLFEKKSINFMLMEDRESSLEVQPAP